MKFIVSSSVLLKNLSNLSGAVPTNAIVPILENFLFVITDNVLTATASDLQTTITTQIPVDAAGDLSICVPSKLLLDTLRSLPEQPITVNVDNDTWGVKIKSQNGTFKLSGENPVDFPKVPTVNQTGQLVLTSDALLSAINYMVSATSTDDLKPAMTGVYFNLNGNRAQFVATNGHRLVRYNRTDITAPSTAEASFIAPRKALGLLKNTLTDGVDVTVSYSGSNASFSFGTVSLTCRLIDERFPDFENAIPTHNSNVMAIGRTDFLGSLKRILIYANRTTHQVRLMLTRNKLTISAEDLDYSNEASEELLCDYDGEEMEIGFNAKLMAESLSNLSCKMISLEMSTPMKAGLIFPIDREEGEDILMLVMPVALNQFA